MNYKQPTAIVQDNLTTKQITFEMPDLFSTCISTLQSQDQLTAHEWAKQQGTEVGECARGSGGGGGGGGGWGEGGGGGVSKVKGVLDRGAREPTRMGFVEGVMAQMQNAAACSEQGMIASKGSSLSQQT